MADHQTRAGRRQDSKLNRPPPVAGVTYFLGIGIDEYVHWPRLQNAVRDVQAIADLLVSDYGLELTSTYLLFNEAATETRIVETFEELTHKVQPTDSLLIYYAGHGHLNDRGRGFWVPVDAPRGQVVRYIRNSTIKDYIGDIPSLHTLLISDSCFSGSLFTSGATRGSDLAAEELARLPSRWAICSGRHDEVVADGPGDGHSPFAESILDVLRYSARPLITTGFLVQEVIEQTRANYEQLPDGGPLQGVGHKRGQFVFRRHNLIIIEQTTEPSAGVPADLSLATHPLDALVERKTLGPPFGMSISVTYRLVMLLVVLCTGIPLAWLFYQTSGGRGMAAAKGYCYTSITAVVVGLLIWYFGRVSLSYRQTWSLGIAAGLTSFVLGGIMSEMSHGYLFFFLAALALGSLLALPTLICIWWKKR